MCGTTETWDARLWEHFDGTHKRDWLGEETSLIAVPLPATDVLRKISPFKWN